MTHAFSRHISGTTLMQLLAEGLLLFGAVMVVLHVEGHVEAPLTRFGVPVSVFSVLVVTLNGAFGLYQQDAKISIAAHVARLVLVLIIAVPLAYVIARLVPGDDEFNATLLEAASIGFAGLVVVR
jgi:hypothetical protein